jgi:hypothetical protein
MRRPVFIGDFSALASRQSTSPGEADGGLLAITTALAPPRRSRTRRIDRPRSRENHILALSKTDRRGARPARLALGFSAFAAHFRQTTSQHLALLREPN